MSVVSASRANVITFKNTHSWHCFIHSFRILFYCSSSQTFSATRDSCILPLRKSLNLCNSHHKRYGFSALMTLPLYCIAFISAWDCLYFCISLLFPFPLLSRSSLFSGFLAWVGFFLGFHFLSVLTSFAEPFLFFILQLFSSNYGTHKNNAESSSPKGSLRGPLSMGF